MLENLIAQGEGSKLEFKSTVDSAIKIAKTLAAFANTHGGILLIGVSDDRKITGIRSELQEMEKIEHAALFLCEPPIEISYETQQVAGKQILVLTVAESIQKPHYVKIDAAPIAYVRAKDKSVPVGKSMTRIMNAATTIESEILIQSKNVKNLVAFLQKNESITVKKYAKMINVSADRAGSILKQLTWQHVLLIHDKQRPITYSLK